MSGSQNKGASHFDKVCRNPILKLGFVKICIWAAGTSMWASAVYVMPLALKSGIIQRP